MLLAAGRGMGAEKLWRQSAALFRSKSSNDCLNVSPKVGGLVKDAIVTVVGKEAIVHAATGCTESPVYAWQLETARNERVLLHVSNWVFDRVQKAGVDFKLVIDHVERTSDESVPLRARRCLAAEIVFCHAPVEASRQTTERAAVYGDLLDPV